MLRPHRLNSLRPPANLAANAEVYPSQVRGQEVADNSGISRGAEKLITAEVPRVYASGKASPSSSSGPVAMAEHSSLVSTLCGGPTANVLVSAPHI